MRATLLLCLLAFLAPVQTRGATRGSKKRLTCHATCCEWHPELSRKGHSIVESTRKSSLESASRSAGFAFALLLLSFCWNPFEENVHRQHLRSCSRPGFERRARVDRRGGLEPLRAKGLSLGAVKRGEAHLEATRCDPATLPKSRRRLCRSASQCSSARSSRLYCSAARGSAGLQPFGCAALAVRCVSRAWCEWVALGRDGRDGCRRSATATPHEPSPRRRKRIAKGGKGQGGTFNKGSCGAAELLLMDAFSGTSA